VCFWPCPCMPSLSLVEGAHEASVSTIAHGAVVFDVGGGDAAFEFWIVIRGHGNILFVFR